MKKRHLIIPGMAFLLGVQLLWSTPSLATDYYVDANNGNNTYSGLTPNNGFADLKHAMRQLQAGDTLYVRSGEYHDVVFLRSTDIYNSGNKYNSGTSTQPITVKAYPNETPVLGADAYFVFEDLSWWVFEGLTFQNSAYLLFGVRNANLTPVTGQCTSTAENITIRGNRFQHGSGKGIKIVCGRHFSIENNVFDNLRSRLAGKDTHGVALFYYAHDVAISGNHFIDIGANGIHLFDNEGTATYTDIVITGNEFEIQRPYRYRDENGDVIPEAQQPFDNVGETAIAIKQGPGPILISKNIVHGFRHTTTGQDATGSNGSGIVIQNLAHNIVLRKNHFYDNPIHLNVVRGLNSDQQPDKNLLIHNNIFDELADPDTTGDNTPTGLYLVDVRNVQVFNNTFRSQYGDSVSLIGIANTGLVELSNNAFHNGNIAVNDASQVSLVANYNAWAQVTAKTVTGELWPSVIGANDIITDSPIIDPATWEPLGGSPVIDAGTSISIITSDYNDAPIAGQGYDVGAVEFTSDPAPDTEAPIVSITSPADGSTVSGNVQITAAASDNTGIDRVRFLVDGAWAGKDASAPYSITWDSSSHADGIAKIEAHAVDIAGNFTKHAVYVTVNNSVEEDLAPPSVSILSPTAGSDVSGNVNINIAAEDNVAVTLLKCYVDGALIATTSSNALSCSWNTRKVTTGTHTIEAKAEDAAGNLGIATVNVNVTKSTKGGGKSRKK